jgi:SET domain-containing protein
MLLIRTRVGPSLIHGNGVFTCETVSPGATVWQYEPTFDRVISDEELMGLPPAFREHIDMYAYHSTDIGGRLVLSCDNARFLNHSAEPNTRELPFRSVATRLIKVGEEITCDYGAFCVNWTGFDD